MAKSIEISCGEPIEADMPLTPRASEYESADHLGSTHSTMDSAGNLQCSATYSPFGSEIYACGSHYKFTGKERDAETGNDYFGARYLSSAMGRWTSPDPKGIALRHLLNPQKLNKYNYVLNNPEKLVDPDGLEEVTITYRTFIPAASVTVAGKANVETTVGSVQKQARRLGAR